MKTFLTIFFLFLSTAVFAKCISGDCNNGYGTYVMDDGSKYVGEHKNGLGNGQGTTAYANGDKHVGEYKNDLRDGQGTYTYANGDKYFGEYKNGVMEGQGIITFGTGEWEGEKYVGEFKNDTTNGQGTYTYANGTTETGIWKNYELVTPNNITTDEKRIAKNVEIAIEKHRAKIAEKEKRIAEEKRRAENVEKQKRIANLSNDVWDTYENVNYNFVCYGYFPFDAIAENSVNVLISALKEWNLDGWNFYWQSYITLGEGYQCNKINVAQSRESFKIKKNEMIRFGEATHWGKTFDIYRYDTGGAAGKAYQVYLMW